VKSPTSDAVQVDPRSLESNKFAVPFDRGAELAKSRAELLGQYPFHDQAHAVPVNRDTPLADVIASTPSLYGAPTNRDAESLDRCACETSAPETHVNRCALHANRFGAHANWYTQHATRIAELLHAAPDRQARRRQH
jgi:hypothetical protein